MNHIHRNKEISGCLALLMLSGCCSMNPKPTGAMGPRLTTSARTEADESYLEMGMQFSTVGDFFALVNPHRWADPFETGGTFSWLNPKAWNDDAGRTARVLIGEAAAIGVAIVLIDGGGGGSGDTRSGLPRPDSDGGGMPPTEEPVVPVPTG